MPPFGRSHHCRCGPRPISLWARPRGQGTVIRSYPAWPRGHTCRATDTLCAHISLLLPPPLSTDPVLASEQGRHRRLWCTPGSSDEALSAQGQTHSKRSEPWAGAPGTAWGVRSEVNGPAFRVPKNWRGAGNGLILASLNLPPPPGGQTPPLTKIYFQGHLQDTQWPVGGPDPRNLTRGFLGTPGQHRKRTLAGRLGKPVAIAPLAPGFPLNSLFPHTEYE